MPGLRILLADDHPIVRNGLRMMIDALPDMKVVGEAADGAAAVEQTLSLRPDVVVIDVSMPVLNGLDATLELRRRWPEIRVVALTAHEDRGYLERLLAAGAADFVLKRAASEDLIRAIRSAAANPGQSSTAPEVPAAEAPEAALSEREVDILRLAAQGLLDKEIAAKHQLDPATAQSIRLGAMAKLGLKSRAGVVRHAQQRGWLPRQ